MAYHNNGIMVSDVKELIDIWDFEKNRELKVNPGLLPVNSNKKVFWKCNNGHFWKEGVKSIYARKTKCFYCSGRSVWSGENDLQTLYPALAIEWDYEKNKVSPDKISPKDTKKYWWRCTNGHPSFERSVNHRVTRHDTCPYCTGSKAITGVNDLQTLYPEIASEWDHVGNEGVNPNSVSPETWKSYKWICPKGHHYSMKVHLRTHSIKSVDCPKCVKAHSTSFPEQAIFFYTKKFYPMAINRYKGLSESGLELDIFIPNYNIGIEYDGALFHNSVGAREREKRKYDICKKRNIKLIRIRENSNDRFADEVADIVYHIKKRPSDSEMDAFLITFFSQLELWSRPPIFAGINESRFDDYLFQPIFFTDINIHRDRPVILEYLVEQDKSFGSLYPELAKNWDNKSNGSLTPYMLLPGSNHKVFFICERCGEKWSATVCNVVSAKRVLCKKCSMQENGLNNTKRIVELRGSLADYSKKAVEQWDVDANGSLTPFDIPKSYSKSVFWKCPICNYQWSQSPQDRYRKEKISDCPHCTGRVAMSGVDDLQTLYPSIANEWDYTKNDKDVKPSQLRPHSNEKRYWICSKHGISIFASPNTRVQGCGCYLCKSEKIKNKQGFKVEQYSKDLKYIKTFASINEAGRVLGISPEAIRQAAKNGSLSVNSYWKYEGTEFGVLKKDKKRPIIATNIKTGEEIEFESSHQAQKMLGVQHSAVLNCCKGKEKYNTTGGYYWRFKGDNLAIRKNKSSAIPILGINKKTKEIIRFESITAAAKALGMHKSTIASCCSKKYQNRRTAGGYYWEYENNKKQ